MNNLKITVLWVFSHPTLRNHFHWMEKKKKKKSNGDFCCWLCGAGQKWAEFYLFFFLLFHMFSYFQLTQDIFQLLYFWDLFTFRLRFVNCAKIQYGELYIKEIGKPRHVYTYIPRVFPTGTSNSLCSTVFIGKHDLLSHYCGLGPKTIWWARQILWLSRLCDRS